jgi:hypothetical protein
MGLDITGHPFDIMPYAIIIALTTGVNPAL